MSSKVFNVKSLLKVISLASDPATTDNGILYYNTSSGALKAYVGGSWQLVTTGTVSLVGQALLQNKIIVGDGSNLSASVDTSASGDILADSSGGLNIKSGVIVNADINASAAIALSKLAALTASRVVVTDGSGVITIASYAPGDVILRTGTVPFTGNQSLGSNKITSLADPTSAQDAATKAYVDSVAQGLKPKTAARVASTANIVLATALENGDVIDGVTLVTGDRVLVKDQTAPAENGIYVAQASGAAVRATDFDSLSPIDEINGSLVAVQEGTANAGKVFVQTGVVATLNTDPINFTFFNSVATLIGGDMITLSGSTISVDLASTSGLESSNPGNSAGQLRVKLEASNPSLQINGSNELGAKLDGSTVESSASGIRVKDGGITNAKVASGIDAVKLANGSVSNTEFQYLDGVTSAIQTQINSKIGNVVEDTTPQLGGDLDLNGKNVEGVLMRGALSAGANVVEQQYVHSITLTASTTAVASALNFAHATYQACHIDYTVKEASTGRVAIGTIRVASNGTDVTITDVGNHTGDVGVSWDAAINGANVELSYTTTANNKTMRADIKRFKV